MIQQWRNHIFIACSWLFCYLPIQSVLLFWIPPVRPSTAVLFNTVSSSCLSFASFRPYTSLFTYIIFVLSNIMVTFCHPMLYSTNLKYFAVLLSLFSNFSSLIFRCLRPIIPVFSCSVSCHSLSSALACFLCSIFSRLLSNVLLSWPIFCLLHAQYFVFLLQYSHPVDKHIAIFCLIFYYPFAHHKFCHSTDQYSSNPFLIISSSC